MSSDTEALSTGDPRGMLSGDRGRVQALLLRLRQPQLRPAGGRRERRRGERAGVTQDSQRPPMLHAGQCWDVVNARPHFTGRETEAQLG